MSAPVEILAKQQAQASSVSTSAAAPRTVVVVGGGPGGLAAAEAAALAGARVRLIEGEHFGGQIDRPYAPDTLQASVAARIERLDALGVERLAPATVFDVDAEGALLIARGDRAERIPADAFVLATGSTEWILPVSGWTLPGVVGLGGLQALVKGGLDLKGKRILVAGSGPLLAVAAHAARAAGGEVVAAAEAVSRARLARLALALLTRPGRAVQALGYVQALLASGLRHRTRLVAVEGEGQVEAAVLEGPSKGTALGERQRFDVDLVACAQGLVPETRLARRLGCALTPAGAVAVDADQATSRPMVFAVGELTGVGGAEKARAEGLIAGSVAAGSPPPVAAGRALRRERSWAATLERVYGPPPGPEARPADEVLVCRCENVSSGELLARAERAEGRHAKLHTRAGMGACRGRICAPTLRHLYGLSADRVRPPLEPVSFACLASLDQPEPQPESAPCALGLPPSTTLGPIAGPRSSLSPEAEPSP